MDNPADPDRRQDPRSGCPLRSVAIIPARLASTRLPAKALADVGGLPLVVRAETTCRDSGLFERVIVATDDERIAEAVAGAGGEARMTDPRHPSGTDRIAEVARDVEADVVVNVQGDLPFFAPGLVSPALAAMEADPAIPMATVCVPIRNEAAWRNPNVVKVVRDAAGFALYFSRAPIPARRDADGAAPSRWGWQHVGVYLYRREFLLELSTWPSTELEQSERLEQLRVLERGRRIFVAAVDEAVVEVDTPEDLERARLIAVEERGQVG